METAIFEGNEVSPSPLFLFFQNANEANEKGDPGPDVSYKKLSSRTARHGQRKIST